MFSKEEVCDGRPIRPNRPDEKGTITMKLTTNTNVSVDGVMQGLGGPEEDPSGGFERGGWAMPYFDEETAALIGQVYQRADAFLFGRRTYEVFAGSWGTGSWGANQGDNPISVALNTRPKYVASTTLIDPQWADTTVLSGDVAASSSKSGMAHPPRSNPPLRSSSDAPSPCITPSRETCVMVVSFMGSSFLSWWSFWLSATQG